ncbi:MAG: ABC transporter permease, partial [Bacillota bacterium]|nr:ABC transporter permease [Bacillota bacterium]
MLYFFGELPTGLVFAMLALGIYISLRILNVPDLTTEGSFGVGVILGSIAGMTLNPLAAIPVALIAGAAAGLVTGVLQTKLNIHPVLAGIITMNIFYSINLLLIHIGSAAFAGVKSTNIYMSGNTIFSKAASMLNINLNSAQGTWLKLIILFAFTVIVSGILIWFFSTNLGLAIRATGNNPDMVRASSINVIRTKIIGLCISNSLVAMSGAMLAQLQGFADFGSATGTLIRGLAAVILGGAIFKYRNIPVGVISAIAGAVIYQLLVAVVVRYQIFGVNSSDLKSLTIAAIMAIVLAL